MNKRYLETIIGFFVIVVASFFSYFLYQQNHHSKGDFYPIQCYFSHVDGILKGSDVKFKGVKVGQVLNIHIDQSNDRVVVTVGVQNGIQVPEESSASITSEGLMGGKYISIEPSGCEHMMKKDGSAIISSTQSSISLESLLGKYLFSAKDEKKEPSS